MRKTKQPAPKRCRHPGQYQQVFIAMNVSTGNSFKLRWCEACGATKTESEKTWSHPHGGVVR